MDGADDYQPPYVEFEGPVALHPVDPLDVRVCELPRDDGSVSDVALCFTLADESGTWDVHVVLGAVTTARLARALMDMADRVCPPQDGL